MKRFLTVISIIGVFGGVGGGLWYGGYLKGWLKPKTEIEKAFVPEAQLPGHRLKGDFSIHPYDRHLPQLAGPFPVNTAIVMQMRVINVRYQAVNDAQMSYQLTTPSGIVRENACEVKFEKEGVYQTTCHFDQTGKWQVVVKAVQNNEEAELRYEMTVAEAQN